RANENIPYPFFLHMLFSNSFCANMIQILSCRFFFPGTSPPKNDTIKIPHFLQGSKVDIPEPLMDTAVTEKISKF
ncbi:MAG: hypothetical protein IKQ24_01220, partial [Verrucomicrobia bacterium]|nr:hypothetical protein [Verrucomicrobiota bacterium]